PIAFGCISAFLCDHPWTKLALSDPNKSSILLIAIFAGLASPGVYQNELIWLISISMLILYIYHNQDSLLVRLLEVQPLPAIGLISYGLYVWQGVFTGNGPYRP